MSRAFVKESDGDDDEPLPPDSPHPLYVTPDGLAEWQRRRDALAAEAGGDAPDEPLARQNWRRARRALRLIERKLARAIPLASGHQPGDRVAFGHRVDVADEAGDRQLYRIVGEDQADPARGWISWRSPLAQALIGAEIGETVRWRRPAGGVTLTVLAIDS